MKKIQGILTGAAFVVAIGGAFASNFDTYADAYRSDGCSLQPKPAFCTSMNENDPICTVNLLTYYQKPGCVQVWHIPQ